MNPKKLLFGFVSRIDIADSLSSSTSSDIESIFRTSVLLRIVVEQFIWPPMKYLRFPSASKSGAVVVLMIVTIFVGTAELEKLTDV